MTEVLRSAAELEAFCQARGWRLPQGIQFCCRDYELGGYLPANLSNRKRGSREASFPS